MKRRILVTLFVLLMIPHLAAGSDGVFEINQTCATETGCFPGDAAGFPVTLTELGGSYVLTSSLAVGSSIETAIQATANRTTLDLNGFELRGTGTCIGPGGSSLICLNIGSGVGVSATGAITVRNGSIKGFGSEGLDLGATAVVEDLIVEENGDDGIIVGARSRVSRCTSSRNFGIGIAGGDGVHLEDSSAFGNSNVGILLGQDSLVLDSRASNNGGHGIQASHGSLFSSNTASGNEGGGLVAANGVLVLRSRIHQNEGDGISVVRGGIVRDNLSSTSARGIVAGAGALIVGNTSDQNSQEGIVALAGSLVTDNTSYSNTGHGISMSASGAVQRNLVLRNDIGIAMTAAASYRGNVSHINTSAVGPGINMGDNSCNGAATCP